MAFKRRPVLILGKADHGDYNVLPVSRITDSSHIDADYDIRVDLTKYPKSGLKATSYIRVHKQHTINRVNIDTEISDLANEYPELYVDVLEKLERYNKSLIDQAISVL